MAPAPFMEPLPAYGIKPHGAHACRGNCRLHPLVMGDVAEVMRLMSDGLTWGDIAYYEEKEMKALKVQQPQPQPQPQPAVKAVKAQSKKKQKPTKPKSTKRVRFAEPISKVKLIEATKKSLDWTCALDISEAVAEIEVREYLPSEIRYWKCSQLICTF